MTRTLVPDDAEIATLCARIYDTKAAFVHFDEGVDDGVCWALHRTDDVDMIVFRGSVTFQDWVRDLIAVAVPTRIGTIHAGFWLGMENTCSEVQSLTIGRNVIVAGHSLGAAHASIMTGLLVDSGIAPMARVVFGEPKPGMKDAARIIRSVPGRSYRNGDNLHHDLVTDVPFSFPPAEYVHPTPIIPVSCEPSDDLFEQLGVFAYHHIELYQTALVALKEGVSLDAKAAS